MSYQVLARKWRPQNFQSMMGQEPILRALMNALTQKRLHHAYLFTGTRGVGKTTIARILAKCLNCETGISATPCEKCDTCLAINTGNFVDLIEVDAASRTKVEDTRELLDNVQYLPTNGRFKIYLIDEVHMLSGHSFNALLKTLEEPPEHVKFLLATTDPQKLPITILSRCLQFHLKNLSIEQITQYLSNILQQEKIEFETDAILQIAQAADGSMRDGLSLLDQAIAFGHGQIKSEDMHAMLGTTEQTHIENLLQALANKNGEAILTITEQLAQYAADFSQALESLLTLLHQIAVIQTIPHANSSASPIIQSLSETLSKEDVQLYYQIGLLSRRDLPLASTPRHGFEMALLRMLAFRPVMDQTNAPPKKTTPTLKNITSKTTIQPIEKTVAKAKPVTIENWANTLLKLPISGAAVALASHCAVKSIDDTTIELILAHSHGALLNEKLRARLNEALNQHFQNTLQLKISIGKPEAETPAEQRRRQLDEQHQAALQSIETDQNVQTLVETFGATINPDLIESVGED